ncbi:MAG: hypothetical protein P0120_07575 [Nitrospira sp.]|nr:hypothetical protein [Nitrospira sp.]
MMRGKTKPGVGPVLTTTLLATIPERGTLTHKQISALVGGALQSRSRAAARKTPPRGRSGAGSRGPLYGGDRGHAVQSRQSGVRSALGCGRKSQQSRADGVHAQIAGHLDRDAQTAATLAAGDGTGLGGGIAGTDSTEIVVRRPIVGETFSRVNHKTPKLALDSQDSC